MDDEGEANDPSSETITHIGPVEGKLLRGSDGRLYALEITRLTPRDANYVPVRSYNLLVPTFTFG